MIFRLSFGKYVFLKKRNIYFENDVNWHLNFFSNFSSDPDINGQITVADFKRAAKKGNVSRKGYGCK